MKIIAIAALVAAVFCSCYLEDGYLFIWPPQTGKAVLLTIRAKQNFSFDQEKVFGGKRNLAISQYTPLYTYLPQSTSIANRKIHDLLEEIASLQSRNKDRPEVFAKYLTDKFAAQLKPEAAAALLQYGKLRELIAGIWTIGESIQKGKIVEDLDRFSGKSTVQVLYPEPVGTVSYPASDFMDLRAARQELRQKAAQLFWQVDDTVLDATIAISVAALSNNLKYDKKENDRRIEAIVRKYPSSIVQYDIGDVLVRRGKILTEEDSLLLNAYLELKKKSIFRSVLWLLGMILIMAIAHYLVCKKVLKARYYQKPVPGQPYAPLIAVVLVCKAILVLSSIPIYFLPVGMLPLLLILLNQNIQLVPLTTVLGAALITLFAAQSLDFLFYFIVGAITTFLATFKIRKYRDIFLPSLVTGLLNSLILTLMLIDWGSLGYSPELAHGFSVLSSSTILQNGYLQTVGWGFLGGLMAGPIALVLMPLLEIGRQSTSLFKLHKYADLQHPLLCDLLTRAPGTYQHSMAVASLAQAAGESIEANVLLLRTGAYFHDVGKMVEPDYFIENQTGGINPHDQLPPLESTRLIADHVRMGERLAREAGIPKAVTDFIPQHHGTLLIEYFFEKALQNKPAGELNAADFRYPGPKPQSVEAAILMVVDAVEAASRTLQDTSRESLTGLVRVIVEKRFLDGQFDECELSTADLNRIIEALVSALEAFHHKRVEYPWQQTNRNQLPEKTA
jgi:cyclic-di-AMP phosphodiesterase PgpH